MDATTTPWLDGELAGCAFADERLAKRLRRLLEPIAGALGESLPLACQDWADTKAAYRFFANERVSEAQILAGHFHSARQRFAATGGVILVVQDTTEFSFRRERAERVGLTWRVTSGKDKAGRSRMHTVCGLLMHASLAATTEGLPLGLSAVKFWSRQQFKGAAAPRARGAGHGLRRRGLSAAQSAWSATRDAMRGPNSFTTRSSSRAPVFLKFTLPIILCLSGTVTT